MSWTCSFNRKAFCDPCAWISKVIWWHWNTAAAHPNTGLLNNWESLSAAAFAMAVTPTCAAWCPEACKLDAADDLTFFRAFQAKCRSRSLHLLLRRNPAINLGWMRFWHLCAYTSCLPCHKGYLAWVTTELLEKDYVIAAWLEKRSGNVVQSLWWLPTLLEAFARSVGSSIVAWVNTAALWSYICWPVSTNALAIHPGFAFPQSREVNGNRIITCRGCEFCLVPNQWLIDWISIGWDPFWWGLWRIIQVQIFSSESNLVCPLCWRQIECAVWSTQLYWPSNSSTYQVKECTIIRQPNCCTQKIYFVLSRY